MGHMAANRSLYDILGVSQDASPDVVRKAYKRKALQTHPDKLSPGATIVQKQYAETRFREVCSAFDILSNPAKRKVYDNGLNYLLGRAQHDDFQAKLSRERDAWARQAEMRQQERMQARRESSYKRDEHSSFKREERPSFRQQPSFKREEKPSAREQKPSSQTPENAANAEMVYRERIQKLEAQLRDSREQIRKSSEALRAADTTVTEDAVLTEQMLEELRKRNPDWEERRKEVLRRKAERMNSQDNIRYHE